MPSQILRAPQGAGTSVLGKTLPSLLYDACARFDNPRVLNQPVAGGWASWSHSRYRTEAEETALGWLDMGLDRGDRVAMVMDSDAYFCIVDMGCLIAGIVDVPIYVTHAAEQIQYVIAHSGAKALAVSSVRELERLSGILPGLTKARLVVVAQPFGPDDLPPMPSGIEVLSLEALRARGRHRLAERPGQIAELLEAIRPRDLATIIYTSGTTGQPKGVMLSHENIAHNALTSFSCLEAFRIGPGGETALSFLPMTHIFARSIHYGFVHCGSSIYFSTPDDLRDDLLRVRPTIFATVPRVLEKVYGGILKRITEMQGLKKRIANWSLSLASRYELGTRPSGWYRVQMALADRLVFSKWRAALGGRVQYLICGGAALAPELANLFGAAGVQILQGYGLTETSPVIAYNRPGRNRAGTVGEPIPGVEVRIADDGEILTRGPHLMLGYYRDEERTREVIDRDGWFHTGDVGEITPEGFLRITDRKKDLFKLSTGKYVMPQPLENRLRAHPLVEQAIVIGNGHKYCTALLFPEPDALRIFARSRGIDSDMPLAELVRHPRILARYQQLVDGANRGMDPWSTIKRFALVPEGLSIENALLTPTMKMKRSLVQERFAGEIRALYEEGEEEQKDFLTVQA